MKETNYLMPITYHQLAHLLNQKSMPSSLPFYRKHTDLKRAKWLVQGQTAGKWQTWVANLYFLIPTSAPFSLHLAPDSEFELASRQRIPNPESRVLVRPCLLIWLMSIWKLEDCKVPPGSILLWLFLRNDANEVEKETQVDNFMPWFVQVP